MPYRPTAKTEARRAAQKQLLLKSALTLVTQHGFQGLTISALAKSANVATGTVYKYFNSKSDLCTAVFKSATEKEVNNVRETAFPNADSEAVSCRQRLVNAITTFTERAVKAKRLAYALIAEPVDPQVDAERLNYRQAYADIYAELIREGIKSKEFPEQSVEVSASALVGVLAETLIAPLGRDQQHPLNEREEQALLSALKQFCLRAITGLPT
ncbi:TetR/AcrR family transcriptional regulator [Aestuariicella hydrocarbonica]|uniref:TetR/AcrR family transcriptional regulator n=1 Tax=Pseudomaricurvus hydrocarbonicus TaxID=1470433 RepID=A0A9E5T3F6_9GAMM|nr:TetR/AcrR family transcriptional regulator [Aestuariicella hydrocarbonica]NHO67128.1 TetR/AcrR family transcriptional regulator [Aestuariicella hydrocarbonica]